MRSGCTSVIVFFVRAKDRAMAAGHPPEHRPQCPPLARHDHERRFCYTSDYRRDPSHV